MNSRLLRNPRTPDLLALVMALLLATGTAPAATLPLEAAPYSYYANNTPLERLLKEFCANFGLRLNFSAQPDAPLNGRLGGDNPTEFLNTLAASYGLDWFYHAGTLHVSRVVDRETRAFAAAGDSAAHLKSALGELGILEARFGWASLPDQGVIVVSGPHDYVQLIASTVQAVQAVPTGHQVSVRRLKYANVEDRQVTVRGTSTSVPGMKTVLRSLGSFEHPGGSPASAAPAGAGKADTQPAESVSAGAEQRSTGSTPEPSRSPPTIAPRASLSAASGISIESDTRLNAIVLRGPAQQVANYERLIEELDVPAGLVEIEAVTIDVNRSRLEELGVDWQLRSGNLALGMGDVTSSSASNVLALGLGGTAASGFQARIRALELTGDAYVIGKPSILTTENLGATIDLSQTINVRVSGERVANLVPVTVGVMLKVTPRIVQKPEGPPEVQLIIDIEDGTLVDRTGLELPVVQRTAISTQAVVLEGQGLLIGGYDSESQHDSARRTPGLANLPWVGGLFRTTEVDRQRRKRMFLITPRIVSMAQAPATPRVSEALAPTWLRLEPLLRGQPNPTAP